LWDVITLSDFSRRELDQEQEGTLYIDWTIFTGNIELNGN
jgi:hypothetical protein